MATDYIHGLGVYMPKMQGLHVQDDFGNLVYLSPGPGGIMNQWACSLVEYGGVGIDWSKMP